MAALLDAAVARKARPSRREFPRPARAAADRPPYDVVVAGAGFAGSVLAERLAAGSGKRVLVCDRRPHVAGNAYDCRDAAGILVHRYGPHIFHTNSDEIVAYLSRFTEWRPYEHRVLADLGDRRLPMPINRTTLAGALRPAAAGRRGGGAAAGRARRAGAEIRTARDVVVSAVGRRLYETFFEGYTRKQWGLDPSELDKSVTARVPTRSSLDDRYFLDSFQAMPREGYTRMFERMLDHELIDVALGTDYHDLAPEVLAPLTIYTGPIDGFFGHRFGHLPYRSLEFRHETHRPQAVPGGRRGQLSRRARALHPDHRVQAPDRAGASADLDLLRVRQGGGRSLLPGARGRRTARSIGGTRRWRGRDPDVIFAGRLGTYQYFNMDQVVGPGAGDPPAPRGAAGAEQSRPPMDRPG